MTRPIETSLSRTLPFSTDEELRRAFLVTPDPLPGNFRFGRALEVLDQLAEDAALAYVRRTAPEARVVTAAIDRITVRSPADVARDMEFHARVNHVWRTSLEVGIRVEQPGDPVPHVASCYCTMVARQGETSIPIPPLEYGDALERKRAQRAVERREMNRRRQAAALEPPRREEYELLARLHAAQEQQGFRGLLAGRLVRHTWERMYPEHEHVPQKIFGGHLMHRAYELAEIGAEEIAPDRVVCVAVNRVNFFTPVRIGDKLHFASRVVYTGRASICVEVEIERISLDRTTKALSNTCVFTFVNVDRELKPRPVPAVYPTTYAEDRRYIEAYRRHRRRQVWKQGRERSALTPL